MNWNLYLERNFHILENTCLIANVHAHKLEVAYPKLKTHNNSGHKVPAGTRLCSSDGEGISCGVEPHATVACGRRGRGHCTRTYDARHACAERRSPEQASVPQKLWKNSQANSRNIHKESGDTSWKRNQKSSKQPLFHKNAVPKQDYSNKAAYVRSASMAESTHWRWVSFLAGIELQRMYT